MSRLTRRLEQIMDWVPAGVELGAVSELVAGDLARDADLAHLVGQVHRDARHLFARRSHVPRIRPILIALAARSVGAESVDTDVQHAAELLHIALVVHDLALGREGGRRRWVARRLARRSVSWLGGNHLTLRAMELTRYSSRPELLGELLDTLREVSDGQALSRDLQQGLAPTEQDWLDHADLYTGALFSFCCRAGGHLAGCEPHHLTSLGRYGRHVGRIWHVAEDVSALRFGDGGAHVLSRAISGRPMLPLVLAAERNPTLTADWLEVVRSPDLDRASALACAVVNTGGDNQAWAVMVRESWSARRVVRTLDDTPYRHAMERLVEMLVTPGRPKHD